MQAVLRQLCILETVHRQFVLCVMCRLKLLCVNERVSKGSAALVADEAHCECRHQAEPNCISGHDQHRPPAGRYLTSHAPKEWRATLSTVFYSSPFTWLQKMQ